MNVPLMGRFAQFISEMRYEDLPDEVIHQAKLCLLDFSGVALAGSNIGLAPLLRDIMFEAGGNKEATVIGEDRKVPVFQAALLNAVKGHALDMDDGHRYANAHPGATVIPAALAVAEKENASATEIIVSIVAGYEIIVRISRTINPSHLKRGFHTTGTVGPFGAAAACCKPMRLGEKEINNALSIAGLQGAGLLEVLASGQMMKPLHPGKAAQAGVLAALMARAGAEGPGEILEGGKGYFSAFSDSVDTTRLTEGLGANFEIMGVYFKIHAACRHIHPSLDALLEIMNFNGIAVEDIEDIRVNTYPVAFKLTGQQQETSSELGAKFSIPTSIALALLHGNAGVDVYSRECVENPAVKRIAERTRVVQDEWRDRYYPAKRSSEVTVTTKRGTYRKEIEIPRGDPENPFTHDELREKFRNNAAKLLPREVVLQLEDLIMGDKPYAVRDMMDLLHCSQS
jgi:2-methylcitrate dehydratase PrpD